MTTLNVIKGLIEKLRKEEIKSLIKFLNYYQDNIESKGKSIQLIEYIINNPKCTTKEVQIYLYGNENYNAFNKLLKRLKDKIYEVLLFDHNLNRAQYSKRNKVVFELRKKLVQSEILYFRRMTDELESFQNKIIEKARQYEVYDSLIEALNSKQRLMLLKKGKKAVESITKEIETYEQVRNAVSRSRNLFTLISSKSNLASTWNEYKEDLISAIDSLKADYLSTKSPTIEYYLGYLETEYYLNTADYKQAEIVLSSIKKSLLDNPSIFTETRLADVLINLSNNEIYLRKFHSAIENALEAQKYYEPNSSNFLIAREIEFFARFYNGDVETAQNIIAETYSVTKSTNSPLLFSRRAYLYACIKTIKGEIEASNELLTYVKEIEKDKEGWNLHSRILTIINRIEAKDYESADLQVLRLEKFIKRTLKIRHIRKRDIIILRILLKLINDGFNFKKVYTKRIRYFNLLEGDDPEYKWKIKSPEMIIFHIWFKEKLEQIS